MLGKSQAISDFFVSCPPQNGRYPQTIWDYWVQIQKTESISFFPTCSRLTVFCGGCWPLPNIMKTCTVGDCDERSFVHNSNLPSFFFCLNLFSRHKSKWDWESWIVWNFMYVNQDKLKMTACVVDIKAISFVSMKLESWQVTKKPFKGDYPSQGASLTANSHNLHIHVSFLL